MIEMPNPQLVQLFKNLQQAFISGNLKETGVLLARLKVRLRSDQTRMYPGTDMYCEDCSY